MDIFRMDILCILIYFLSIFILCDCISWKKFSILMFSGHECIPTRSILETAIVPEVLTCGRVCFMADKCLGYWHQPDTQQCSTFGGYANEVCTWRRKQTINPGKCFYTGMHHTLGSDRVTLNGVQRENSYYFAPNFGLTFNESVAYCNEKNASVIVPETADENKFLSELFRGNGKFLGFVWLGITDIREEGTWELLSSGQPVNYTDWWRQKVPAKTRRDNCVGYFIEHEEYAVWETVNCSLSILHTVCEKRIEE